MGVGGDMVTAYAWTQSAVLGGDTFTNSPASSVVPQTNILQTQSMQHGMHTCLRKNIGINITTMLSSDFFQMFLYQMLRRVCFVRVGKRAKLARNYIRDRVCVLKF